MLCPSCSHENIEGTDRCENCMTPLMNLDVPQGEATSGLECSVMEDNLSKLDHEAAVFAALNTPAFEVVKGMRDLKTGCALVMDGKQLAGIFTEHDVLTKLAGASEVIYQTPVKELMSLRPETLNESDSIAAALNKMSTGRYRHIPVVKHDGSLAVISIKNVLRYIAQADW
jgi:CBS domain-containing protein